MLNVDHTFGASPIVEDVHDEGSQSGNTDLSGVTDPYGEKEEKTTRSISLFAKRFWAVMKVAIVIAIACVALYALYYKISNKEATPTELTPTDTIMPTEKPDSAVSPVIEDTGLDSTDTLASEEPEVL